MPATIFNMVKCEKRHILFDDPAKAKGSEEKMYAAFRRVRDEIRDNFSALLKELAGD